MTDIIIRLLMALAVAFAVGAGVGIFVGISMKSAKHGVKFGAVIALIGFVLFSVVMLEDYFRAETFRALTSLVHFGGLL